MNHGLLTLAWLAPLLLLPLLFGRHARIALALAALPALLAATLLPVGADEQVPWLFLGMTLHLDQTGAWFLLFSSLVWLSAGTYGALTMQHGLARFGAFFLLACAGNLLLIVAADMVTFYVGFALMGLAATGLIAHRRSQRARRAARIYLAWTLVGEMALFTAVVLLVGETASTRFSDLVPQEIPALAVALLLFGFGIKLALPGLHFWLPLAYTAAPAAAAAVLSGPMISAGLLGWVRFLPPGGETTAVWSEGLVLIGVIGTCLGTLAGLLQRSPRAVLGYSSIAKMGLLTAVFGAALTNADAAPAIIAALVVFAMHHLMLKGTLFLGIGEWQRGGRRPWLTAVTLVLVLAMIGAPYTSGAGAKLMMEESTTAVGLDLGTLLSFSALGTVLLMTRLMWLLIQQPATAEGRFDPASLVWLSLAVSAILLPLLVLPLPLSHSGLGIIVAGLAIAVAVAGGQKRFHLQFPHVPPGDLLYLSRVARQLRCGRFGLEDLSFSPRALLVSQAHSGPGRHIGAMTWLLLCIFVLAITLLPG